MCFDANFCGLMQTYVLSRRGMRCSTDTFATMQTKLANPTLLQMTACNPIKLKEIARVYSTAVQQIEEEESHSELLGLARSLGTVGQNMFSTVTR